MTEVSNTIGGLLFSTSLFKFLGPSVNPILITGISVALLCVQAIVQFVNETEFVSTSETPLAVIVNGTEEVQLYVMGLLLSGVTFIKLYDVVTGAGVGDTEKGQLVT